MTVAVRRIVVVALDCPTDEAVAPPPGRRGPSVAEVQHAMLTAEPFRWTENEVLFESWWRRQDGGSGSQLDHKSRENVELARRT